MQRRSEVAPESRRDAGSDERFAWVDAVKAIAILAVVLQHSGPPRWSPEYSDFDRILRVSWIQFHVPAFLVIGGFLAASHRMDWLTLRRRLARILVPYLVASICVQLLGLSSHGLDASASAFQLATGSSLGIYYYVFLHVSCLALMLPLSRLPSSLLVGLLLLLYAYAAAACFEPRIRVSSGVFWTARDPLNFYLAYFLTGWLARLRWSAVLERLRRRAGLWRALAGAAIVLAPVVYVFWVGKLLWQIVRPVQTLAVVGLLASVPWRRPLPAGISALSRCTLGIYLFHSLWIRMLEPTFMSGPPAVRTAVFMGAGVAGAMAMAWLSRHLLGPERAARWLGF